MRRGEEAYSILGFDDRLARLIGIPLAALCIPLLFLGTEALSVPKIFWSQAGLALLNVLFYWHVDREIVIWFRKKMPGYANYWKRQLWQALAILLFTALSSYLSTVCVIDQIASPGDFVPSALQVFFAAMTVTVLAISIYESIYAVGMWKQGILENERLKRENTQAQLEALKNQVNPHFLFNSLNTLASVIPEDPQLGVQFVENLSRVYRYILEIKKREFISVRQEMQCIDSFQFLMKIRFGQKIIFENKLSGEVLGQHIIPLSIQLLLENAIKHNVVSSANPLWIRISSDDRFIIVTNNLQPKKQPVSSTGTGLENIKMRYLLLTKKEPQIEKTEVAFTVRLPIIFIRKYGG